MFKMKSLINVFLLLTILLGLHPIENSIAGSCDEKATGGRTSTCTGDHNYTGNWPPKIQFDPSNPDQIDRNDEITIKIIGGCSPYTWSVSGNGFRLQDTQTTGLTNTLIADGSACGTATITVTGCVGPQATGYVRCKTGGWYNLTFVCGADRFCTYAATTCTAYVGPYRYIHYRCVFGGPNCMETCEPCSTSYGSCPIWECQSVSSTYGHCWALGSIARWEWTCP
jgi:hypothetical protein